MNKRLYKGSLLAQKILLDKVEKTHSKEDMLYAVNYHYRLLLIVQVLAIFFSSSVFWFLLGSAVFASVGFLFSLLLHSIYLVTVPFDNPVTVWLDNWQLSVVLCTIMVICFYVNRWADNKMESIKQTVDNNQLNKDYLNWREKQRKD